jgi:Pretoxin HINT domain
MNDRFERDEAIRRRNSQRDVGLFKNLGLPPKTNDGQRLYDQARYGRTCFPSSALVKTPHGWKEIGKLKAGDFVICYDHSTGAFAPRQVTRKLDHSPTLLWNVYTSGAEQPVATTANHPFLTASGWKNASKLVPGDQLTTYDDASGIRPATVLSVERTGTKDVVHNLHTAGEHTYIVAGFIVHNFAYFRRLRSFWHRLFIDERHNSAPSRVNLGLATNGR